MRIECKLKDQIADDLIGAVNLKVSDIMPPEPGSTLNRWYQAIYWGEKTADLLIWTRYLPAPERKGMKYFSTAKKPSTSGSVRNSFLSSKPLSITANATTLNATQDE